MKTLLKYDFLYFIKTPRLIIFMVLAFFLSALSAVSAAYMNVLMELAFSQEGISGIEFPEPTVLDAYLQFFGNYNQIFMLVLIFIAAGLFTSDKSKNHYPFIFTHAIAKETFVVSKLIVITLVSTASIAFGALIFGVYTYVLFEAFDVLNYILAMVVFIGLMKLIILFTAMVSFIFKNYMLAVTLSIIMFILLGSFTFLDRGIFIYFPHQLLNYPMLIMENDTALGDVLLTFLVAVILMVIMFVVTLQGFKKRPLT